MAFDVLLTDGSTESVADADGYAPEGPLTTFFSVEPGRQARLDTWSVKLLSIRTDRIVQIRRTAHACGLASGTAAVVRHLSLAE